MKNNQYIIGEIYWATNLKAGKNMQSCGTLIGWTKENLAILQNSRWGKIYATIDNLNRHN